MAPGTRLSESAGRACRGADRFYFYLFGSSYRNTIEVVKGSQKLHLRWVLIDASSKSRDQPAVGAKFQSRLSAIPAEPPVSGSRTRGGRAALREGSGDCRERAWPGASSLWPNPVFLCGFAGAHEPRGRGEPRRTRRETPWRSAEKTVGPQARVKAVWNTTTGLRLRRSQAWRPALLVHVPDVDVPFPGAVFLLPVDDVFDGGGLAGFHGQVGAANFHDSVARLGGLDGA